MAAAPHYFDPLLKRPPGSGRRLSAHGLVATVWLMELLNQAGISVISGTQAKAAAMGQRPGCLCNLANSSAPMPELRLHIQVCDARLIIDAPKCTWALEMRVG
jgi:hypothetical protein